MDDSELLLFEPGWVYHVNKRTDPFFYKLDYDVRHKSENMQFQHFHFYYEMMICLDQACDVLLGRWHYRAEPLDIICIKPSLLHRTNYLNCESANRIVIQFSLDELPKTLLEEYGSLLSLFDRDIPIYRFSRESLAELFAPLNDLFRVHQAKGGPSALYTHTKFTEFLLILNHIQGENTYFSPAPVATTNRTHEITEYILNHYMEDLTLENLSERFHISPYYLSHLVKSETGFTLTSNIQLTRIRNAQKMLIFTDLRIAEIAEKCGFNSFSQFNRTFMKYLGVSPSQYRKQAGDHGERGVHNSAAEAQPLPQPHIPVSEESTTTGKDSKYE